MSYVTNTLLLSISLVTSLRDRRLEEKLRFGETVPHTSRLYCTLLYIHCCVMTGGGTRSLHRDTTVSVLCQRGTVLLDNYAIHVNKLESVQKPAARFVTGGDMMIMTSMT